MAYIKTNWQDRVVEKPRTYIVIDNPDGTVTLTPAPGAVVQEGTPVNASRLNKIEQGIADAAAKADLDAKFHATAGHKHTGVAGQGPLLGVDSQVWMQPGNDVILEDLPEKTVYTVGVFKYKVPYPGKYRLTGEFRLQEGKSTTIQFGFLEDDWRHGPSSGHVRELVPVTVSATSTTMSLSFSSFTLDLSRARPTPGYLYVVVAVDAGSWGDPESRVRNLRVRGTPAAGNPSWL